MSTSDSGGRFEDERNRELTRTYANESSVVEGFLAQELDELSRIAWDVEGGVRDFAKENEIEGR